MRVIRRVSNMHRKLRDGGLCARNKLLDASYYTLNVGLRHISTGSCLNSLLFVRFISSTGKEKNRCLRIQAAHTPTQFEAVEVGQLSVEEIQVEAFGLN